MISPTSSYKKYLILKALLKYHKTANTEPQNFNTIFKFPHLKTLHQTPKAFYTSITDSNNILLPDS